MNLTLRPLVGAMTTGPATLRQPDPTLTLRPLVGAMTTPHRQANTASDANGCDPS